MQQTQLNKYEIQPLNHIEPGKGFEISERVDGRLLHRRSVSNDKLFAFTLEADSVTNAMMTNDSIKQAELDTEEVTVNITAGQPSGTGTCTSGSKIIGWRPAGNVDQLVDDISVSGTTVTVTLAANATGTNNFIVVLLKA